MTNYEEIVALVIFVPCLFCVLAGCLSMASYRCACCGCPNGSQQHRPRRSCLCPASQELPMSVFRLTQHNYRRVTSRGNSTILDSREMSVRYMDEGESQVVSEFDYRQNLHLECGVLALEPPPPYAEVEKDVEQVGEEGNQNDEVEEEGDERNYAAVLCVQPSTSGRGEPPPYQERDRAASRLRNMVSRAVRVGRYRRREAIQLGSLPSRESSNGSSDDPEADISGV